MRMDRKGYVYTVISMMLALVLLSVVSLYYESYKSATDISPSKLRTDELHYFVESAKKDLGRAMSISARRGAAYLTDYVINNHTTISNPTNTLKQVMVNGTITSGSTFAVPYMQNQTLNYFISLLQTSGSDLRFRTNVSVRTIDVYLYDSLHYMVVATYNFSIADRDTAEGGVCGYENENQTLYALVPIDGLEDPLYAYKTSNKVSRVYNHSTQSGTQALGTGSLGHGTGGGMVFNLTGYSAVNQDTKINNFNTSNYSMVPYTVFVISVTQTQFLTTVFQDSTRRILNNSGGVINLQSGDLGTGFPYVSGISGTFDLTGKDYVIVRNGNTPQVLYMGMANDIVNRLYANSTNGSSFFDRLQGNANLTQTYRDQAATARALLGQSNTAPVGIESYINLSDLNSSGLYASITPVENYSSIDYLYFQGMPGKWVYGTPYWFRMDAYNFKTKNLTDYCDDDYAAVWHFEESYTVGSDVYTYESSHNGLDLQLITGDAYLDPYGKTGNGIFFGGNVAQAEANVNVSETAYTMGLWFRAYPTCIDCGIFSTDGGSSNDGEYDRDLSLDNAPPSGGHLCAGLFGPEVICTDPGDTYNDDTWHYVVQVFENKTGGEQKIYVDGVLKKTGTLKYSNRTAQTRVIVGSSKRASDHFLGWIDDVKIWNRALAPWEITEEYEKQR
jgi:hypothetical protein